MLFHEDSTTRRDGLNSLLKCSILRNLCLNKLIIGIAVITTIIELFTLRKPPNLYEIDIQPI